MTETELGIGLAGPLLNAQTLGHEQRAVEAQARRVLVQYEQTILVAVGSYTKSWVEDGRRDEKVCARVFSTLMASWFG